MRLLLFLCGSLLTLPLSARADQISIDGSWHEFMFDEAGSFATSCGAICTPTSDPVAEDSTAAPWTFTGAADLKITDILIEGDQFEVFDNSVELGITSTPNLGGDDCGNDIGCALANPGYSHASFNLGAGSHSITIEVIQNAPSFPSGIAAFSIGAPIITPEPNTLFTTVCALSILLLIHRFKKGETTG